MQTPPGLREPKTTTDIVFDRLYEELLTLRLLPGAKISEAEVASRLGVSRQPVRDAFNRLGNLGLLLIRPQRSTEVRGFSIAEIENARLVRQAVELEIIVRATAVWDEAHRSQLADNLAQQRAATAAGDTDRFHALDYDFHRLICELAGHPLAFRTIETCKRAVDRLCMLSFDSADATKAILRDHEKIADALASGSPQRCRQAVKHHLRRLDETIREIQAAHSDYFE